MNELDMIRALLSQPPPSAEVIAEGRRRITARPTAAGQSTRQWGRYRVGLAAAAAVAVVAATLTAIAVTPGSTPAGSVGPTPADSAAPRASFGPATSAAGVLRNVAVAALQVPAGAPLPGQFVYIKLYLYQQGTGTVTQTWSSADGTHVGLIRVTGPHLFQQAATPACRDGYWYSPTLRNYSPPPRDKGRLVTGKSGKVRCSAAENAAYLPSLPTSPAALRSYFQRVFGVGPGTDESGELLTGVEAMMTHYYLTPAQRAALYGLLAQTQGLTVVPHATNIRGQTGVGIRSETYKGSVYMMIFSRTSYQPLGMNWTGVAGPIKGSHNGEVLLRTAIVNRASQLP